MTHSSFQFRSCLSAYLHMPAFSLAFSAALDVIVDAGAVVAT